MKASWYYYFNIYTFWHLLRVMGTAMCFPRVTRCWLLIWRSRVLQVAWLSREAILASWYSHAWVTGSNCRQKKDHLLWILTIVWPLSSCTESTSHLLNALVAKNTQTSNECCDLLLCPERDIQLTFNYGTERLEYDLSKKYLHLVCPMFICVEKAP